MVVCYPSPALLATSADPRLQLRHAEPAVGPRRPDADFRTNARPRIAISTARSLRPTACRYGWVPAGASPSASARFGCGAAGECNHIQGWPCRRLLL